MQNARTLNGHEDVARLLLQKSADITAMNKDNEIALHVASRNGNANVV
jgi:ankyrin repeat protein